MISRRKLLMALSLAVSAPALAAGNVPVIRRMLAELERKHGGRLGVAMLDTAQGEMIAHRGGERFAMCSTFKFLAAGFVLSRVDRGQERLDRRITYGQRDLIRYSPVAEKHIEDGLTVAQTCEAAVTLSDNTAANLMLDSFGGPAGLTAFARSLDDRMTRLDRREPELNEARPGDPRDTTTPAAMLGTLRKLVLGDALSVSSREQLANWLVGCKTGDKRLRAGVPKDWKVGDKTGTGGHQATNDIAVLWPPGRAPILVTAFFGQTKASEEQRNAVLASVGSLAAGL